MLPIPKLLIKKEEELVSCAEDGKRNTFKIPKYHGQKVDCIRQILSRDLQEGEPDNNIGRPSLLRFCLFKFLTDSDYFF
jgi:hypothetical protein